MFDSLGDRMKFYEQNYTPPKLMHTIPIICRLDGKAFHSFTRNFNKPFDLDFIQCMDTTAKILTEETNAKCSFTQSDEITLVYYSDKFTSQVFMDGKRDKLNSVLSSMCTGIFNDQVRDWLTDYKCSNAYFDCRTWNVPSKTEACNVLIWRQQDAIRNSIQMLGHYYFSSSQLYKKSCNQIQEMLFQKHNINWNHEHVRFKRGVFNIKRTNEDRSVYEDDYFELSKLENREEVIFDGAEPRDIQL